MKRLNYETWNPWKVTKPVQYLAGKSKYCPYCSEEVRLEYVHGHYQCSHCKSVVVDCCDGEKT